jgi:Tol biopolymer transport system component
MKRLRRHLLPLAAMAVVSLGCGDANPVRPADSTPPDPPTPTGSAYAGVYISVLDLGSTTPLALTAGDYPVWSPDGGSIAFVSVPNNPYRDGGWQLYVIDRSGTKLTRLTHDDKENLQPIWSPDGSEIAWLADRALRVVRRDGTGMLTLAPTGTVGSDATWSPDGLKLAFLGSLDGKIHVVDADGSAEVVLPVIGTMPGFIQAPTWSPDGSRIAFIGLNASNPCSLFCSALYVISAQGGAVSTLADSSEYIESAAWSPDGSRVAFVSFAGGACGAWDDDCSAPSSSRLYVIDADGAGRQQLADFPTSAPTWSRDGQRLLVLSQAPTTSEYGLVAIPVSGQPPSVLSTIPGAPSPDGESIVFTTYR